MKIIGHRGAAGLALENTTESIEAAIQAGVDAIEFDIRVTKDGKIVLSHDRHLGRVSNDSSHIHKHSLAKLRRVPLHNGQKVATLTEAMKFAGGTPVVIEGKESGWARPLATFLQKQKPKTIFSVISFNHQELYTFSLLMPNVPVYAVERTKPFDVIRTARLLGFTGVDLNFWLLNPFTYLICRYYKLKIIVYTVNYPWMASFLRLLYPSIAITTNVPDKMQFLRRKNHKTSLGK